MNSAQHTYNESRPAPGQARTERPGDFWSEAEFLGRALLNHLDYFEALGVEGFAASALPPEAPKAASARPARLPAPDDRPKKAPQAAGRGNARQEEPEQSGRQDQTPQSADSIAELSLFVSNCQGCPLAATRPSPPAPGRGGTSSPLIAVVGPTPAIYDEEPRKLLTGMIENTLGLSPDDYYVTTLVKCPPPGDEVPPAAADHNCRSILLRELELLSPRLVLALGKTPGQKLSGSREHLALLRPKTHKVKGAPGLWLRVTYGLEDLLDSQALKIEVWKDLQKIKLGLQKMKAADNGRRS